MKTKIYQYILLASMVVLYACCGGNSIKTNEIFGKIPSLVSNFEHADSLHKAKTENDVKNLKVSELESYLEQFKKEEEEALTKLKADVKTERDALKDKPVPFSVENENFEVKDLKISDEEMNDGKGLKLFFTFEVKKPIELQPYSNNYVLKYKILDKDGNQIEKDKQLTLILGENYETKIVQPGKKVTQDFYVSLKNPLMVHFKEIVFF